MKLIFWTKIPFLIPLKIALWNALSNGFCSAKKNNTLLKEFFKYLYDLQVFIRTATNELRVNLSNKIISRRKKFRIILDLEQKIHERGSKLIDVAGIILRILKTRSLLSGNVSELKNVLIEGNPVIIVVNHPYAPIDGLLVMNMVHKFRYDYFQLVNGNNGLVSICPEFNYRLIPVDLSEGSLKTADPLKAKISRAKVFRQSFKNLYYSGQCLIMFPAGNISKAMCWGDPIQDTEWLDGVGLLVKLFSEKEKELQILPIYIDTHMGSAKNSFNYQLAFLENKTNVSAALMHAFFNPPSFISLHIGDVLKSSNFQGKSKFQITQELRQGVYKMAGQLPIAEKLY